MGDFASSHAITASAVDVSSSLMILGHADGTVTVWHIQSGVLRASPRRHVGQEGEGSPVVAVAFQGQRYVVSMAADGSMRVSQLQFHATASAAGYTTGGLSAPGSRAQRRMSATTVAGSTKESTQSILRRAR